MAINPTDIQFNQQKQGKTTWPKGFLILTIFLLIFVILSAVVVKFLTARSAKTLANLEQEIAQQEAAFSSAQSNEVLNFQNELANLKTILNDHVIFSNALNTIALNTHQQIQFLSLKVNYDDKIIEINGVAPSNEVIAQASTVFSGLPNVLQVGFKNIKASGNGMQFIMTLNVLEKFFKS